MTWQATTGLTEQRTGRRRGITMQTWDRYVRMCLDGDWATILYRLHNKAHRLPVAAT